MSSKDKLVEKLVDNVKKYPTNITAALKLTATQAKVPFNKVRYLYYGCKKHNIAGIRDTTPMFITQSDHGFLINTKTSSAKKQTKTTLQLYNPLISIPDLTPEDKVAFFDMIFR